MIERVRSEERRHVMEIRPLDREKYAGRKFTARYRTSGYYDIRATADGFRWVLRAVFILFAGVGIHLRPRAVRCSATWYTKKSF